MDEARLKDVAFHRRQDRWIVIIAAPCLFFWSIAHFYLTNYLQTGLFVLMFINAIIGLILGQRLTDINALIRLKRISGGISFALLAVILLTGIFTKDAYIFIPWLFLYPIAALIFFGRRAGIACSLAFALAVVVVLIVIDPPPLTPWNIKMLKLNALATMATVWVISAIYERIRARVLDELAISENQYKLAEIRQRETNAELQQEIIRREQSEKALEESELHYRALFEESSVALWEEDWSLVKIYLDHLALENRGNLTTYFQDNPLAVMRIAALIKTTAANRASVKLFEIDQAGTMPVNLFWLLKDLLRDFLIDQILALSTTGRHHAEISGRTTSGRNIHLQVSSALPAGYEKSWGRVFTSIYDLTERIAMEEEKKRMDQKMHNARQIQAIATLAGGIAHQFNNALAVIYGSLDLIEMDAQENPENRRFITTLKTSAGRMSRLTDQLLAYAEGGKYHPQQFSVNDLVSDLINSKMMVRDASIQIVTDLNSSVRLTTGDTMQIKMVVEVVLSNAFEALTRGGMVRITTGQKIIEDGQTQNQQITKAGDYTFISIEDNGAGMKKETLQHIFEPFFTTKIYGRGLGMAAAFGIVRNHDGMITVDSEPGKGTCVIIYLPSVESQENRMDSMH